MVNIIAEWLEEKVGKAGEQSRKSSSYMKQLGAVICNLRNIDIWPSLQVSAKTVILVRLHIFGKEKHRCKFDIPRLAKLVGESYMR